MSKQICEDARSHSSDRVASRSRRRNAKQRMHVDPEDSAPSEGMKNTYKHSTKASNFRKDFGEHLSPLYGFLNKQVGRPWNDVFSEICEQITIDSTVQRHIREHVFDLVEINIRIINGKPHEFNPYAYANDRRGWILHSDWRRRGKHRQMYVDPEDGILKMSPVEPPPWKLKVEENQSEKLKTLYFPKDDLLTRYHRINGVWYAIGYRKLNDEEKARGGAGYYYNDYNSITEVTTRRWQSAGYSLTIDAISEILDAHPGYWPMTKKQLNKNEVRRIETAVAEQVRQFEKTRIRRAA